MNFVCCTLYNSLYLDKGLVLYDSLCENAKDFKLYVLCMDDKCYEVLSDFKYEHQIPIRLSDFERGDKELLDAKANRPFGEYCWTCTPSLIRYIFNKYKHEVCTYIDADMFFYSDPQILVDEMLAAGKSVMVPPHRFPAKDEKLAKTVGTYCVEFNTFCNTPESLEVLEYWRNRCLECCSNLGDGVHWGDQKYLEELVEKFDCVHVCQNKGAGVAPWNIMLYEKKDMPIVFYHFQSILYISRQIVNTNVIINPQIDFVLINKLYYPYLKKLEEKKRLLERTHNILPLIQYHPANNERFSWKAIFLQFNLRLIFNRVKQYVNRPHQYIINISNDCQDIIS